MSGKQKTVIIGAGGHCKVIIDMLSSHPQVEIVGCTDNSGRRMVLHVLVLGNDSILPQLYAQGIRHSFVAIGDNYIRNKLARYARNIGFTLINVISPYAYVSPSAQLGSGIAIMPHAVLNAEVHVQDQAIINTGATVDHESILGEACHVAPRSNLSGNVYVKEGTFLGTGTKVIDGITIGAWSVLGAGSVVICNLPDRCLAVGVPARVIKHFEEPNESADMNVGGDRHE